MKRVMRWGKSGRMSFHIMAVTLIWVLFLTGCEGFVQSNADELGKTAVPKQADVQRFQDPSDVMTLTAPKGWVEDTRIMPFDMAVMEEQKAYYTGVMLYYKRESGGEQAILENLQFHIKDIALKREDTQILYAPVQKQMDNRTFTRAAIRGEYEGKSYAYLFTAIDFGADEDAFAILIQTCHLEDWGTAQPILEEIGDSCRALSQTLESS